MLAITAGLLVSQGLRVHRSSMARYVVDAVVAALSQLVIMTWMMPPSSLS
jgi:hypothetical protein